MSGTQTFTYTFTDPTNSTLTDTVAVNVSTPPTNSTGTGLSEAVTSIAGTIGGNAITGELVGNGPGTITNDGQIVYDNAVFFSDASGADGSGNVYGSTFGLDNDGLAFTTSAGTFNLYDNGGTLNLYTPSTGVSSPVTLTFSDAPCYLAGTLIATADGEMPVEALGIGEFVQTANGAWRPIRWVGCRSYAGRFLHNNPQVQPIRFAAGSLGEGLPRRDLFVSPEHAMFLNGVLVPARCLVNAASIVQDRSLTRVDYYHIELDSHDILLAEGAPSESFVDDDSRGMFQNASTATHAEPARSAAFCGRRVEGGFELDAIRRQLATFTAQPERVAA